MYVITAASFLLLSLIHDEGLQAACCGSSGKENGKRTLGAGMKEMMLGSEKEEAQIEVIAAFRASRDYCELYD